MALFTHEDDEGDELEVMEALNDHRGQLVFNFACRPNSQGVFLPHDRVAALHAVLGAWLELKDPMQSSVVENSLIDQLITRRVAEEVARTLPLFQAPQALYERAEFRCTKPGSCEDTLACSDCQLVEPTPQACTHGGFCRDANGTQNIECPEESKYIDASRVPPANRLLSELTRMADVAMRSAQMIQESSRVWGTDGTSPNGPVPQCQARGCGHEYAQHIEYADSRPGCKQCTECPCVRYRSQA